MMTPTLNHNFLEPTPEQEKEAFELEQEILKPDSQIKQKRLWSRHKIKKNELPKHIIRDPLLWSLFKRVHYEDKNVLIIFVGETGAGKSWSAVNIANMLDVTPTGQGEYKNNFIVNCEKDGTPTPDCRVIFSATDLIRLVKSKLPKGSAIVWDEAGIGNDNTRWWDKKSILIKHVMQSFRAQNLILFLTVPDEESVALATRRLLHATFDVYDRDENFAYMKINWLQRDRKGKKVYRKTQSYKGEDGFDYKITDYMLRPMSDDIAKPYKKIKDKVLGDMNAFYEKEMELMEKIEGKNVEDKLNKVNETKLNKFHPLACAKLVQENLHECKDREGYFSKSKTMLFLAQKGYSVSTTQAKALLEGLDLEEAPKKKKASNRQKSWMD